MGYVSHRWAVKKDQWRLTLKAKSRNKNPCGPDCSVLQGVIMLWIHHQGIRKGFCDSESARIRLNPISLSCQSDNSAMCLRSSSRVCHVYKRAMVFEGSWTTARNKFIVAVFKSPAKTMEENVLFKILLITVYLSKRPLTFQAVGFVNVLKAYMYANSIYPTNDKYWWYH